MGLCRSSPANESLGDNNNDSDNSDLDKRILLGKTKHYNHLNLDFDIAVTLEPQGLIVTDGQPFETTLKVSSNGFDKTITADCGRKKSDKISKNYFNNVHFWVKAGGDYIFKRPETGNFYFQVKIIHIDGTYWLLWAMQNGEGDHNPWYLGGASGVNGNDCCMVNSEDGEKQVKLTRGDGQNGFRLQFL